MCRYASEHVQTMVEDLGKAVVHGYVWVWAGCWCGWVCVGGASVSMASVAGNSIADEYWDGALNGPCMHHAWTMGGIKAL